MYIDTSVGIKNKIKKYLDLFLNKVLLNLLVLLFFFVMIKRNL